MHRGEKRRGARPLVKLSKLESEKGNLENGGTLTQKKGKKGTELFIEDIISQKETKKKEPPKSREERRKEGRCASFLFSGLSVFSEKRENGFDLWTGEKKGAHPTMSSHPLFGEEETHFTPARKKRGGGCGLSYKPSSDLFSGAEVRRLEKKTA